MFQRLNGKKGLILVALVTAILVGAYAAQFYTWTVGYRINQLTSFERIVIPKTTGATAGVVCWEGYGSPEIDGELDDCYGEVITDTSTESGDLPIRIYTICDDEYMYWFFEALSPTTEEEGIGDTNILWNAEYDGEWLMVYLQEAVYDNEGIWTSTPMPDAELDRHCYDEGGVEICDTLEAKIPRSYAECLGWTYDAWSKGTPMRNTGWGTQSYGDIGPGDWLDCPCHDGVAEIIQVDKPIAMFFKVDADDVAALAEDYWRIIFSIHIFDKEGFLFEEELPLVIEGEAVEGLTEADLAEAPELIKLGLSVGDVVLDIDFEELGEFGVMKDVLYWTGAVEGEVSGSFTLEIFAVELEAIGSHP